MAFAVTGTIATLLVLVMFHRLYVFSHSPPRMPETPMVIDPTLPAMPRPDFAKAEPLPDAAAIAAAAQQAREDIGDASYANLPVAGDSLDAYALALVEAAPAVTEPRRPEPWDLFHDKVPRGAPVLVKGAVRAAAPKADGWRRSLLEIEPDIYVETLVRGQELPVDQAVEIAGFYLGSEPLPASGQAVDYPIIAVRAATPVLPPAGATDPKAEDASISDDTIALEPGPYAAMLAQVAQDEPSFYADPPSLNYLADAVHREPGKYRGEPFTVTGNVVAAWVDEHTMRAHPELGRVVRMLLYHRDLAPLRENVAGEEVDRTLIVQRYYDVAARSDQELPKPNDPIIAKGRFLKFLARPLDKPTKPMKRVYSDRVFSLMLVAPGFEVKNLEVSMPFFTYGIMAAAVILSLVLVRHAIHVQREASARKKAAKANEEIRRQIREKMPR